MSRGSPQNRPADFTATFLRLIDLDEVRVWRMSRRVRLLSAVMAVAMLALTTYGGYWAAKNHDSVSLSLLVVFVVIDVVVARMGWYAFRSITTAEPEGVFIGRGRRAAVVPWGPIEICRASDRGIVIDCSDGRRILAAAPQHSNAKRGQHTKTDADYAALYITERARLYRLANAKRSVEEPDALIDGYADLPGFVELPAPAELLALSDVPADLPELDDEPRDWLARPYLPALGDAPGRLSLTASDDLPELPSWPIPKELEASAYSV